MRSGIHSNTLEQDSILGDTRYANFFKKIFQSITALCGYEVSFVIPKQLFQYDRSVDVELRIIERLKNLGVVTDFSTGFSQFPDEPKRYITRLALSGKQRVGYGGTGADFFNRADTLWPAIGEAVERWSMDHYVAPQRQRIIASNHTLRKPKIDIHNLAGFSPELRSVKHQKYELSFSDETMFEWIVCQELTAGKRYYAPLQMFSNHHVFKNVYKEVANNPEPLLRPLVSTGLATGVNESDAVLRGLLEVIERDAFMIYWLNSLAPDRIEVATLPGIRFKKISIMCERHDLELYLLHLKTDMPVHTVLSIVLDRTGIGPAVMVGAKSDFDLERAAYGATVESLGFRGSVRKLQEKNNVDPETIETQEINHLERILLWAHPSKINDIEFLLSGTLRTYDELNSNEHKAIDDEERLSMMIDLFRKKEYPIFQKEIIPRQVQKATNGLSVVKVVCPDLIPLSLAESLPVTQGNRIFEIPKSLGLTPANTLNTAAHPFP